MLFVCVPKVASRSLLTALTFAPSSSKDILILELNIETLLRRYLETKAYFKFMFVRNPWSRAVSRYLQKIKNANPIKQARLPYNRRGLEAGMPFEAVAEWLNSGEGCDDFADKHWMFQYRILSYDQPDIIAYDFIERFERLAQDYQILDITHLKLPKLPHILKSKELNDYRVLYNDRSIELIARRYCRDIKLFNYDFDEKSTE